MKTLLSCDQVFETLTRGPFPSGGPDDDAAEQHLAACHECRCLAEALRPAATLFHESLSAVEQEQLPAYAGLLARLTEEAVAQSAGASPEHRGTENTPVLASALRFGSALLLAISLCIVLLLASGNTVGRLAESSGTLAALPMVRTVYRPNHERLVALASQHLPAVCFPTDWKPDATAGELACCSQCHAPGALARNACAGKWNHSCRQCHESPQPHAAGPRLFAVLQQSCLACHDS